MDLRSLLSRVRRRTERELDFGNTHQYLPALTTIGNKPTRVVSFSLYGTHPRYLTGAVQNVERYLDIFPDWQTHFFVGDTVPESTVNHLKQQPSVSITQMRGFPEDASAMLWRFLLIADPQADIILFRDTDSRPSLRERAAVDQWLSSNRAIHIMRDHAHHVSPIMGGAWGVKGRLGAAFMNDLRTHSANRVYGDDMRFLEETVYNSHPESILVHQDNSPFVDIDGVVVREFPTPRVGNQFVGQGFEEDDTPRKDHE